MDRWKPSAINDNPIIIKKLNANILKEGCFLIKKLMGCDAKIIITTATITDVYMTQSSCAIPMAVMIESIEKTKSNKMISNKSCLAQYQGHIR